MNEQRTIDERAGVGRRLLRVLRWIVVTLVSVYAVVMLGLNTAVWLTLTYRSLKISPAPVSPAVCLAVGLGPLLVGFGIWWLCSKRLSRRWSLVVTAGTAGFLAMAALIVGFFLAAGAGGGLAG